MIPCILLLLAAAAFALMSSRPGAIAANQYNNSEIRKVNMNAYEVKPPVQVVQPVESVQAIKDVTVIQ